ncbi:MAG: DNA recombination protein RmuC [Candidatus Nanopelagicaceae bacterium]
MQAYFTLFIGLALGALLGYLLAKNKKTESTQAPEVASINTTINLLKEKIGTLESEGRRIEVDRKGVDTKLFTQLEALNAIHEKGVQETQKLAGALGSSQTRGKYGEAQLENLLRFAGLKEHIDFEVQSSPGDLSGIPDVIVHMAEKLDLYIDSKFPYARYFEAINTENFEERKTLMKAHASDLLGHVDALSKRKYDSSRTSANFVVLFAPFESILAEALIADPILLEKSFEKRVVIATPSTLLGMLRTVKLGIDRSALANSAEEIRDIATKLVSKLVTNYEHISTVSKRLNSTVTAFNSLVGNVESTVTAPVRAMIDKGITNESLPELPTVDARARDLNGMDSTDTSHAIRVDSAREESE